MMSAMDPPLHEKVYDGLKQDFLAGNFVPGRKIDIQELATRYRASKTPVREAAFILVGEGLFKHHSDGGFLVHNPEPAELIELYALHMQLIVAALSSLRETSIRNVLLQIPALGPQPSAIAVADTARNIFAALAEAAGNRQASILIRCLNERLHYARIVDAEESTKAERELATITEVDVANLSKATRRRVEAYHLRKIDRQLQIMRKERPA